MSVVVAIRDGDLIYIGADSQKTKGHTRETSTNINNLKIFKPLSNKNLIIGFSGDYRDRDILYCSEDYIGKIFENDSFDYKFIVSNFVPNIFSLLKHHGRIYKGSDNMEYMDGTLIITYKNKLYRISSFGVVTEIDDYCAIGTGENFAIGYLNEGDKTNLKEALIKSLKSAIKNDIYLSYPIIIMNNKNNDIEVIEKLFR